MLKISFIIKIFALTLSYFLIGACSIDGPVGNGEGLTEQTYSISGYIQKGPFISGSSIAIQELNEDLEPTGISYQTTTTDDFGYFTLGNAINSRYAETIAQGFYYNEVAGQLSLANLTLRAISDLSVDENVNVNILTTLEKDRIKHLFVGEGETFIEAKIKSETEILSVFNIGENEIIAFEQMDISKEGDSNGILLAVSAIIQSNNTVAELSELISKINLDIEEDGTLDNSTHVNDIKNGSMGLNLSTIRVNLSSRYESLGLSVTIPAFEDYVDSDGDGILNKYDQIPFTWVTTSSMLIARQQAATGVVNGTIYVIGGIVSGPGTILDVVEEYDPIMDAWITKSPMPVARYRTPGVALNGKIYIISSPVEVYDPSSNNWTTQLSAMPTARSQLAAATINGKIYAIGGQPTLIIDEYDPIMDSWLSKTATGVGREGFTASVVNCKIYLVGGWSDSLGHTLDIVEQYDPVSDTIITKSPMTISRCGHVSSVINGAIYVIGGWNGGGHSNFDDVEKYDPSNDSWAIMTSMPTARHYSSVAVINDGIYVIGGESSPDENLSLVEKYYPQNDID